MCAPPLATRPTVAATVLVNRWRLIQHRPTKKSYPASLSLALVFVLCIGCSHPSKWTSRLDAAPAIGSDAAPKTGKVWAIAAGLSFTCACLRTGVKCWGSTVQ
jgi:hypothetical protein